MNIDWTQEHIELFVKDRTRVNHLLALAMGKCWHEWEFYAAYLLDSDRSDYRCKLCKEWRSEIGELDYFTKEGFWEVWRWLWIKGPALTLKFLIHCCPAIDEEVYTPWYLIPSAYIDYNFENKESFLFILAQFLIENQKLWGWVECPVCRVVGGKITRKEKTPLLLGGGRIEEGWYCSNCHGTGKIEHPALQWAKEEGLI